MKPHAGWAEINEIENKDQQSKKLILVKLLNEVKDT